MRKTVVVVDYGMGNLRSVVQAVRVAAQGSDFEVVVSQVPETVRAAERVILPGQGAMPDCMRELRNSGLRESVLEAAREKPLFGVCVGMQMLLSSSEEGGAHGLDLIPGDVVQFRLSGLKNSAGGRYKVPQMGWNQVLPKPLNGRLHTLWQNIALETRFYFVHSFYVQPEDTQYVAATTDYGGRFASAIAKDNMFATQFHPEKSATHGLQLYRNFLRWSP